MKIIIEVSARHIHLSQKDYEILFGRDKKLKELKKLSQTGQFATPDTVILSRGDKSLEKVRVLGPWREQTQVEISRTDAVYLGINPPLRCSGNLKDTPGIMVVGPAGELELSSGVIVAQRHIHASPEDAKKYGLANGQEVSVKVNGERSLTFHKVLVRVKEGFVWRCHLDTDEANAAGIRNGDSGEVIV